VPAAGHLGLQLADPPYPQPVSLSTALLSAQLLVLGSMLASMSESNQLSILNVRSSCELQSEPKQRLAWHEVHR